MNDDLTSNNKIRNQNLVCKKCGVGFVCTSGPPGSCWCHYTPNLLEGFDLAGECLCPDCLAKGKRESILEKRKTHFETRKAASRRK